MSSLLYNLEFYRKEKEMITGVPRFIERIEVID